MAWAPVKLSNSQRKYADRVGGIELIMPWPDGLPRGEAVRLNEERDATPDEHAVAQQIVGASCRAGNLIPVRSQVATLRRPSTLDRGEATDQHLCVIIIGRRWVGATGDPAAHSTWVAAGRIPRAD